MTISMAQNYGHTDLSGLITVVHWLALSGLGKAEPHISCLRHTPPSFLALVQVATSSAAKKA